MLEALRLAPLPLSLRRLRSLGLCSERLDDSGGEAGSYRSSPRRIPDSSRRAAQCCSQGTERKIASEIDLQCQAKGTPLRRGPFLQRSVMRPPLRRGPLPRLRGGLTLDFIRVPTA